MKKVRHINMFHHGDADKKEIYCWLQDHYDRDSWIIVGWNWLFWVCAFGAVFLSSHTDWLWIFGGVFALQQSVCTFIDQSNRNWFMHSIDWGDAER